MNGIVGEMEEVLTMLPKGDDHGPETILKDLTAQLLDLRERYESALKAHGIPLPY